MKDGQLRIIRVWSDSKARYVYQLEKYSETIFDWLFIEEGGYLWAKRICKHYNKGGEG